jgi:polygalacturonase
VLAGAPALAQPPRLGGDDGWKEADAILARIKPPAIPRRDFPITRFGAKPGGEVDCTKAIAAALAAAAKAGGGRVVVPAGVWLTGAVHLKSNTELHVAKGATLKFSRDPAAYLPNVLTRHEGVELMNYSPFIYALDQHDIALTGERDTGRPGRRRPLVELDQAPAARRGQRPQAPGRHGRGGHAGRGSGCSGPATPSAPCSSSPIAAGTC